MKLGGYSYYKPPGASYTAQGHQKQSEIMLKQLFRNYKIQKALLCSLMFLFKKNPCFMYKYSHRGTHIQVHVCNWRLGINPLGQDLPLWLENSSRDAQVERRIAKS